MAPANSALPKFKCPGCYVVSSPMLGLNYFSRVAGKRFHRIIKAFPLLQRGTLHGQGRGCLAFPWPAVKIVFRYLLACLFCEALYSYLSHCRGPEKENGYIWILLYILSFFTVVVCEKNESLFGKTFEQDYPGRGFARDAAGREYHCIGLLTFLGQGVVKPLPKLDKRIFVQMFCIQ